MKRSLCLAGFFLLSAVYTAAAEDLFDIKPVADGVYAAISKPAYKVNCNAAIILFDDSVLVVDTHSKPSAARALIEQIKKLTDKPVRYVAVMADAAGTHSNEFVRQSALPVSFAGAGWIVRDLVKQTKLETTDRDGRPRLPGV